MPAWLDIVAASEGFKISEINYIFCSDEYLLQINRQYLKHDYYTDIITFDNSENQEFIEADIFVSTERVKENSHLEQTSFFSELLRVIVHGLLHLIGYDDSNLDLKQLMRNMEDKYLDLYFRTFNDH